MAELPSGAVTFLFTDIEGSTRLVKQLRQSYGDVLAAHQRLLREAFANHNGYEVDTQGDSFFVAFESARDALLAAVEGQLAIASHPWPEGVQVKVRMGIHTGQAVVSDGRYTGLAVHRAARIGAAGHGAQVLVSHATQTLLEDEEEDLHIALRDLGEQQLKDLDRPVRLYQASADGLQAEFPPLRHEAQLAQAAEAALAPRPVTRRRLAFGVGALGLAALAAVLILLLRNGPAAVTVRPNSVGVIDPKSNRVVDQIPVGIRPGPITSGAGSIWVANLEDRTLSRIDPHRRSAPIITLGRTPTGVAFGEGAIWVANGVLGTVQRVDTDYNTVGSPIDTPAGRSPTGAGIAVGFGSVWFASANSLVVLLAPESGKVKATSVSGSSPSGIAVDPNAVWVANRASNNVYEFSPSTHQPIAMPTVSRGPTAIATGGGAIWVAAGDANAVTRLDPFSLSTDTISVGRNPTAIAYGLGAVWVTNADDGTVSRIDPATNRVTKVIKVGNDPEGVAVYAGRVWVSVQAP
jgi:YVTN family beta-propeller protein